MTVSGIFRDLFGTTMEVLDKAVRCVAALDEPDEMNFVRRHVNQQIADGGESSSFDEARNQSFFQCRRKLRQQCKFHDPGQSMGR